MEFIVLKDKVAFTSSVDDVLEPYELNRTALYYAMVGYGCLKVSPSKSSYFYCMVETRDGMEGRLLEYSELSKTKGIIDKTYVKVCPISNSIEFALRVQILLLRNS